MTIDELRAYSEAWNDHDIDRIMDFMTEDCVFETGGGSERFGTRYEGYTEVKKRFIEVWTDIPDVHFEELALFVQGDQGCSEWTFKGTRLDGAPIEIDGCDLFTFRCGKIYSKRSYLKNRV